MLCLLLECDLLRVTDFRSLKFQIFGCQNKPRNFSREEIFPFVLLCLNPMANDTGNTSQLGIEGVPHFHLVKCSESDVETLEKCEKVI